MTDSGTVPAALLREFFETSRTGFIVTDADGLILGANARFAQWVGADTAGLVGRTFSDFVSVAGKIYIETHIAPLLHMQGFVDEVALDLAPSAGSRVQILLNAQEHRDEAGNVRFVALTLFKSTERRKYELDLLAARNELRDLNASLAQRVQTEVEARLTSEGRFNAERETAQLREQFIAVLGHDLRNPLAGIDGGLTLLLRQMPDERATKIITLMQKSTGRIAALVADLMDFARGRMGGGLRLDYQVVPLESVVSQVVGEITSASPDHPIEVVLDLPEPVRCDPPRIAQLLSNLIANAVSHGEVGQPVKVAAVMVGEVAEISVANTGSPIPPEMLDRLFQPFVRNEVGQPSRGLGLGLYICAEIARAHRGELTVASDRSETRFTLRMPVA